MTSAKHSAPRDIQPQRPPADGHCAVRASESRMAGLTMEWRANESLAWYRGWSNQTAELQPRYNRWNGKAAQRLPYVHICESV